HLTARRRFKEAWVQLRRAQELDPLSTIASNKMEFSLLVGRQYEQALQQTRNTLELDPRFPFSYMLLGQTYAQEREFPSAFAGLEQAHQLAPTSPRISIFTAHFNALAGEEGEARKLIRTLEEKRKHQYICAYEMAMPYIALGEKDEAFRWLERGRAEKCDCMV